MPITFPWYDKQSDRIRVTGDSLIYDPSIGGDLSTANAGLYWKQEIFAQTVNNPSINRRVPESEMWVILDAFIANDTVAATPMVRFGPGNAVPYIQSCTCTKAGGAGEYGDAMMDIHRPVVVPPGWLMTFTDVSAAGPHSITLRMRFVRINMSDFAGG